MVRPVFLSPRMIGQLIDDGPRVILDRAFLRDADEVLRRELQHEGHDADVDVQVLQRLLRVIAFQRRELKHLHALLLRRDLQRIGTGPRFLGSTEHTRYFVLAGKERFQDGLAEVLLTNDGDFHAAFLGGTENAPAPLRFLILLSS
jgi:hypothetical protein